MSVLFWILFVFAVVVVDTLLRGGRYTRIVAIAMTSRQLAAYEWLIMYTVLFAFGGVVIEAITDYSGLAVAIIAPVLLSIYIIDWTRRTLRHDYFVQKCWLDQRVIFGAFVATVLFVLYVQYAGISEDSTSSLERYSVILLFVLFDAAFIVECVRRFVQIITVQHPSRPTLK